MDKETAVKILTAELTKHLGISIISEEFHKEEMIKSAEHYCQFSNPFMAGYRYYESLETGKIDRAGYNIHQAAWLYNNDKFTEDKEPIVHHSLEEAVRAKEICAGANYFFAANPLQDHKQGGINFFVTPYSIIGSREITKCRELFYGFPKTFLSRKS